MAAIYGVTTFNVLTDSNDYVTSIVPANTEGARQVSIDNNLIGDFTNQDRMHLYTVKEDGSYYPPSTQARELSAQIESLQNLVSKQSEDLAKAQALADSQSAMNKQLLAQIMAINAKLTESTAK